MARERELEFGQVYNQQAPDGTPTGKKRVVTNPGQPPTTREITSKSPLVIGEARVSADPTIGDFERGRNSRLTQEEIVEGVVRGRPDLDGAAQADLRAKVERECRAGKAVGSRRI